MTEFEGFPVFSAFSSTPALPTFLVICMQCVQRYFDDGAGFQEMHRLSLLVYKKVYRAIVIIW
jgi:hypothetical protein